MSRLITIGTRGSHLALRQADEVRQRLAGVEPLWSFTLKTIRTRGDKDGETPIRSLGRAAFTSALARALTEGEIDLAVHSLKDVPTSRPEGLSLAVVTPRADPRDALVSRTGAALVDLPAGAVVGTGSARRAAFLLAIRGDLIVRSIRGNVETRLAKVKRGPFDAGIFALAGLARLGMAGRASEVFDPERMTPAPGQGALAVECRSDDAETASLLARAREREADLAVTAERAVLRGLGGGCQAPIGVLAQVERGKSLRVIAAVAAPDGSRVVRVRVEGPADADVAAARVIEALRQQGAGDLLRRV